MKKSLLLVSLIFLFSCEKQEKEYPFDQSPYIEFDDLVFHDSDQGVDTLELSFIVWDREGDIGLNSGGEDARKPFHIYDVIIDNSNIPVTISGVFEPPFFKAPVSFFYIDGKLTYVYLEDEKVFYSDDDIRPAYSCDSYEIVENQQMDVDTFYIERNKFFYNLHVDLIDNGGIEYDINKFFGLDDCSIMNFDARIPNLNDVAFLKELQEGPFSIIKRDRYSWKVSYFMRSMGFKFLFQEDQFEIIFQTNDRSLNESNISSSGLVALKEIED